MSGADLARFRVITLSGEEFQRTARMREILDEAVDPATRDFNLSTFDGNDLKRMDSIGPFADLLNACPMMAARRVIVFRRFDNAFEPVRNAIAKQLVHTPDTTLVVIEGEKTTLNPKPPKAFFHAEHFKPVYENQLPGWIQERFRVRGKKIASDAIALLINNAGTVMCELDNEIEKITVVAGDREVISARLVEAVVGEYRRDTVWNFCNVVGMGDFGEAAHVLRLLQAADTNKETWYLSSLISHIIKLGEYNTARKRGVPHADAMKLLTTSPFLWKMNQYDRQTRHFTPEKVRNALEILAEAESAMKSSGSDNGIVLEVAVARVAGRL